MGEGHGWSAEEKRLYCSETDVAGLLTYSLGAESSSGGAMGVT
jgi:hypothetical protein